MRKDLHKFINFPSIILPNSILTASPALRCQPENLKIIANLQICLWESFLIQYGRPAQPCQCEHLRNLNNSLNCVWQSFLIQFWRRAQLCQLESLKINLIHQFGYENLAQFSFDVQPSPASLKFGNPPEFINFKFVFMNEEHFKEVKCKCVTSKGRPLTHSPQGNSCNLFE